MAVYVNGAGVRVDVPEARGERLGGDWRPVRDSGNPAAKTKRKSPARKTGRAKTRE